MLYLCLAMVLDVAIFTMGLTMSIIDVNRYNFGLYLVLMSVVTFSLLVALWVAKPKFCQTPSWAIQFYHYAVKSSRPNYQATAAETEALMERPNADEIMRSIKGIPLLIQAIQYSLEAAYVPTFESTTAGHTVTDSAIESSATTHEYYPPVATTSSGLSRTSSANGNETFPDSKRGSVRNAPQMRRVTDHKRQSIFVVFPYSDTVPIDQSKLRVRRSSSEHDLGCALQTKRKSSFERFYAAAIAGRNRCASTMLPSEFRAECGCEQSQSFGREHPNSDGEDSPANLKVDSIKRGEVRRPSLEVRYVGLQSILLAKMSAKQKDSS